MSKNINDHLANDRTFLAWVRTSIAIIGLGFVLVKFSLFLNRLALIIPSGDQQTRATHSTDLGIVSVLVGILITSLALLNYFQIKKQIQSNYYKHGSRHIIALGVGVNTIGLVVIWFLLQSVQQ